MITALVGAVIGIGVAGVIFIGWLFNSIYKGM